MTRVFCILLSISFFFSCNSKVNSEKDFLEERVGLSAGMTREEMINSDIKEIFTLLNDGITVTSIDSEGNFSIDMGAASVGRVSGNLKDVNLSIEYLPEMPGCADICPERAVISFKCKSKTECLADPTLMEFRTERSGITIANKDRGGYVFDLLIRIQMNL